MARLLHFSVSLHLLSFVVTLLYPWKEGQIQFCLCPHVTGMYNFSFPL